MKAAEKENVDLKIDLHKFTIKAKGLIQKVQAIEDKISELSELGKLYLFIK